MWRRSPVADFSVEVEPWPYPVARLATGTGYRRRSMEPFLNLRIEFAATEPGNLESYRARGLMPVRPFAVRCNSGFCRSDGTVMTDSFLHIESTGLPGQANLAGGHFSDSARRTTPSIIRAAIGWLPTVVILVAAPSLLLTDLALKGTVTKPVQTATAIVRSAPPLTVGLAREPSFDPLTSEAIAPEQPAPVDGLKISSQSWRRGGLGSNALVTMTLRNTNDYAVRDVEMSCAFARPDGSHLTDRTRLIHEMINPRTRKTFARMHVGFVNVNAARARCSLLTASHA